MNKSLLFQKAIISCFALFLSFTGFSQVTLTATSGTATGSFTTLKGAFDAINAGTHKGAIVIKINASTTETASASLTASAATSASAPYYTSINIHPTTTGLSISGAVAAPLINLNGADSVTIDGRVDATGSTKSLTITNTSAVATAGTSTIRFIGDASSNTVQYCTLKGSSTDAAAGIIFFSTTTATTGNDNNTITHNDITSAADASRPLNAVYALGTTLKNNDNNTISNNNFYDFLSKATASQGINISSYNSGFTIADNSFYETASFTATAAVNYNVILISAATGTGNGFTISGNYIGGNTNSCGGTAWTKTAQNNAFTAISVTTATGTANSIQGNTIKNINWTNAGTSDFTCIYLSGATVANIGTVTGNKMGDSTGTGSITFTSNTTATDFYAINITSTDVVNCQNNIIGSITVANASTNATNFYGIVKSATAGTTTISNNSIGSTTTANSINASSASSTAANIQSVYGIQSAGTGTVTISENTIANMVNATSNTTVGSVGLISGIYVSAGTNTISNNTIWNLSNANANTNILSTPSVSGIVMASATAAAQTVSGNTVYNLSNTYASFAGGVIGIYYSGSTTASAVKGNFIHSLSVTGATSTTANLYGIKINAGATTYSNNIISLGGNTTTNLYGIFETGAASNNNNLYYNTVYIGGSMASGATNTSYAVYSAVTTNTRNFRNNVLVNARSTVSGASKHFALYIVTSGGTITCNYNNYFVSGTGGVLGYYAANKTSLPIVTSNDANSIVTNPTFSNAGGTAATDYTPTVPGTAVTLIGLNVDYTGTTRGTNVSMGAIEVKLGPNAPTNLVATAGVSSATIAFTAPSNLGGGAITNYEYSLDNGASWVTTSPVDTISPIYIGGLTHCTENQIKIRALNVTGGGTASTSVTVTPQNGQLAGINWISRAAATNLLWTSVTYGNGLFVAVTNTTPGNLVMTSPDGINWTTRTSAANNPWVSVTYGNGLFVAVSYANFTATPNAQVMTSPDGINWTIRTAANANSWADVTYGNGLFVAVAYSGTGNRVMTSPDGITWTARTSAADNSWQRVTYGNGLFVAVAATGIGNRVMTSPDGITWTARTSAVDNDWYGVAYGNGLFVAVAITGTGNRVMTSPNGSTWTAHTSAADNQWVTIAYGNGLFVALAQSGTGNRVMTSPDGSSWTTRTPSAENIWRGVTYGNGLFVAVSTSGNSRVMTSSDALAPSTPAINTITSRDTYATVAFTASSDSGYSAITRYEYSIDNGSNWVSPSPVLTSSPFRISGLTSGTTYNVQLRAVNSVASGCGSSTFNFTTLIPVVPDAPTSVAATAGVNAAHITFTTPANDGGSDITGYEYTINNGNSWTPIASTASPLNIGNLTGCTAYSIKIRAVNAAGGGAASAALNVTPQNGQQTGTKWTRRTSAADNAWTSVTYGNGLFVAVAFDGRVMTSPDGITWTPRTSAANNAWRGVTYGNGLFVAVSVNGTGNCVMTSPDGITWTSRTSAANNAWNSVTYGNGLFVAVAETGTGNRVMTSSDGITWTSRTSAANNSWYAVTYGNGLFVAVAYSGTGNRVMTSPDGITWTSRTSAADNQWYGVTYGNGLFVAVAVSGTGNRVMTSSDGITWTSRTSAANNSWYAVTYGNGLFVAVAYSGTGNRVMTSTDGITWTSRTSAADNQWYGVTYANGLFVAVAGTGTGNRVMTSSDAFAPGIPTINSFTSATNATSASVAFTAPTDSGFAAISNYEYSKDNGSTWVTPSPVVTTSPFIITGLSSGTTYPIQLRAVNSASSGCASSTFIATTCTPNNITETISVCSSYLWHGTSYTTSNNTATWTGINASGCDSTVTLNLTINEATSSSSSESACGSYIWNGTTYTTSGVKTWTGTNATGCDSVVTLNLTINTATSSVSTETATSSYNWNGNTYTSSGTYTWTGTNAAGCDSVATLNLTINQIGCTSTSSSETIAECISYSWHGNTYTTSGVYSWIGTNAAGCDSVVTLNLTIKQPTSSSSSESACVSYLWHGTTYTTSGAKTWTGTNAAGCDSVVTLNLTINQPTSSSSSQSASGSYSWNGNTYTISGTYTWTGTNAAGCDSVATLNLTINQTGCTPTSSSETFTACNSYLWHGSTYTDSGAYTWTGTNAAGCDSVVTLNLTIIPTTFSTGAVNGIVNVCPYIGTNTELTYTAFYIPGATYTWTIPYSNVILVSGQGTNTIKLKFTNGFANVNNKQLKVKANTAACGTTNQFIFYLLAQSPVTPASITASSSSVCASLGTNVPITYTIPKAYSAVSYIWSAQTGTTNITSINGSGANDTSVAVTFTTGFTSSNITVQSVNDCGVSGIRSLTIKKDAPPQPGLISGPANACEYLGETGQIATYTVSAIANVDSYTWSLPNGALAVTGQGTRSISFKYPNNFTSGSISVTATNGCGTGGARFLSISRLQAGTPSMIDVINNGACPNRTYSYTLSSMPTNATSVLWTVPSGGTIVSGQGTTSITVSYNGNIINGEVEARAVNNCSMSGDRETKVKLPACPVSGLASNKGAVNQAAETMNVKLFPNPTTSSFHVQVNSSDSKEVGVRIMDVQGRFIKSMTMAPYQTTNIGNDLKAGVYMVEVKQGNVVKTVRVVKY